MVSLLLYAGVRIVIVSRRLGHSILNPVVEFAYVEFKNWRMRPMAKLYDNYIH